MRCCWQSVVCCEVLQNGWPCPRITGPGPVPQPGKAIAERPQQWPPAVLFVGKVAAAAILFVEKYARFVRTYLCGSGENSSFPLIINQISVETQDRTSMNDVVVWTGLLGSGGSITSPFLLLPSPTDQFSIFRRPATWKRYFFVPIVARLNTWSSYESIRVLRGIRGCGPGGTTWSVRQQATRQVSTGSEYAFNHAWINSANVPRH